MKRKNLIKRDYFKAETTFWLCVFAILILGFWMVLFPEDFSSIYKVEQLGAVICSLSISAMVTRIFNYQSIEGNQLKKQRMIQATLLMNILKQIIVFTENKKKTAIDWRACCRECASAMERFYFKATPNSLKELESIIEDVYSSFISTNYAHAVKSTDSIVIRLKDELKDLNIRGLEILEKQLKVLKIVDRY